jgi:tellurite resistance protein
LKVRQLFHLDLAELLQEDGLEKRLSAVTSTVTRPEQQEEVLRVAAFIAQISGGVSEVERATMDKLAAGFGLTPGAVEQALAAARQALG